MLIGRDGLSVLKQMRADRNKTPVLLLSARGKVNQRVEGLNAGAEDYLPKPFALEELIARVGDLTPDTISRLAERAGRTIELTTRAYRLLEFLMRSAGSVVPLV